jgi:hypothetical protein
MTALLKENVMMADAFVTLDGEVRTVQEKYVKTTAI